VARRRPALLDRRRRAEGREHPVQLEGDAVPVTDDDMLGRLADAWRSKWDGRWHYVARDGLLHHEAGQASVFSVAPQKVLAFGKGTFTHTRHRFPRT
jgi:hypothetical protein